MVRGEEKHPTVVTMRQSQIPVRLHRDGVILIRVDRNLQAFTFPEPRIVGQLKRPGSGGGSIP
jgi:hypothetical protein